MKSGVPPLLDVPCQTVALGTTKSDTLPCIYPVASSAAWQPLVHQTGNAAKTSSNQEMPACLPELEHRKRNLTILRPLTTYAIHNVSPMPSLPTFTFNCPAPHTTFPMRVEYAPTSAESDQIRTARKRSIGSLLEQVVSSMCNGEVVIGSPATLEPSSTSLQQKRSRHNRSRHAEFAVELFLATIQPAIDASLK
ncbi:hypothetical protein BC830DRAFT_1148333 [Chytriomyces sp. MP71]|nr:hypothetical protein BC830DRAFT_1148333 [Chytriomyces sp. MP71]